MDLAAIYHAKSMDSAFWFSWKEYSKSHFPREEEAEALLESFGYIDQPLAVTNMSTNKTRSLTNISPAVMYSCFDQLIIQINEMCVDDIQWNQARVNIRPDTIGVSFHDENRVLHLIVSRR